MSDHKFTEKSESMKKTLHWYLQAMEILKRFSEPKYQIRASYHLPPFLLKLPEEFDLFH